jgi:hypothetical protein
MNDQSDTGLQRNPLLSRRSFSRAGLEALTIVIGVLAALAVSEWQESRQIQERIQSALWNVRTELENNLEILEFVHSINVTLIEQIAEGANAVDQNSQFLPALQITESAWQTLGTTGLTGYVDFNLIVTLSETYSLVDVYKRSGYSLVDANLSILATATATGRSMKDIDDADLFAKNFASHFQLIVDIESALIAAHRGALAALDTRAKE